MSETDTPKGKSSSPCEAYPKGLLTEAHGREILRESQAVERGMHPRCSSAVGGLPHPLQRCPRVLADGLELAHERLPLLLPLGLALGPLFSPPRRVLGQGNVVPARKSGRLP